MKDKPLIETHPYLKDPLRRSRFIEQSVISSFGVEGIKIDPSKLRATLPVKSRSPKPHSN